MQNTRQMISYYSHSSKKPLTASIQTCQNLSQRTTDRYESFLLPFFKTRLRYNTPLSAVMILYQCCAVLLSYHSKKLLGGSLFITHVYTHLDVENAELQQSRAAQEDDKRREGQCDGREERLAEKCTKHAQGQIHKHTHTNGHKIIRRRKAFIFTDRTGGGEGEG